MNPLLSGARFLTVKAGSGTSNIMIGHDLALPYFVDPSSAVVIITDTTIAAAHSARLSSYDVITVPPGESSKSLEVTNYLYSEFLKRNLDRSSTIVGFGGGVITDLAGYAAATYLRGIPYGSVATTLLAQVDASIGGKNGVNFGQYKNIIGTIRQPLFCLCDTSLLATLPKRDIACGFSEVIKHAAIKSAQLFAYLEENVDAALNLEPEVMNHIVYESIKIKAQVVEADENEQGERRKLNFGHTIGHALELVYGLAHGEAVSVGMALAARISVKRGLLAEDDYRRLEALITRFSLPTTIEWSPSRVEDAILHDKKRVRDVIKMIFLTTLGDSTVVDVPIPQLRELLDDLCRSQ